MSKIRKSAAVAAILVCVGAAQAAVTNKVVLAPNAMPIRDASLASAFPIMGVAGSLVGEGEDAKTFFETKREETAAVWRRAGIRLVRQWDAVAQWQTGAGCGRSWRGNKPGYTYEEYRTDMKNVFSFYKEYGIKVVLTLENYSVYTDPYTGARTNDLKIVTKTICDYLKWIIDNGFKDVVAGFELGNEPYWNAYGEGKISGEEYAARWTAIVLEMVKVWPKASIGLAIAEYFAGDPDVKAVRNRMLSDQKIKETDYFGERVSNQWSARYIVAMSNALPYVTHVIYHSYGGCVPESCSPCGIARYRIFNTAFPELKGKKMWITEWRERSDEDNRSHQHFRETLFKAGYMLGMVAQPDVDGLNLHQISSLAGVLYVSRPNKKEAGRGNFMVQWDSRNNDRPDYNSIGETRLEVGIAGPMFRLYNEALLRHPLVMDFGSDASFLSAGKTNFWMASCYYGEMLGLRNAIQSGKERPVLKQRNCDVLVTMNKAKSSVSLLACNMKGESAFYEVTCDGYNLYSPDIRVYECPEKFLDASELPGEGHYTRQYGYELYPKPSPFIIEIPANSITTVTIPIAKK